MEKVVLKAEPRKTGRHSNRELRGDARIPAVIYGQGREALAVSLDAKEFGIALHKVGGGLMTIDLAGEGEINVLLREIQRHAVKHNVLHVDVLAVSMTEKVHLTVAVVPEGVAPVMETPDMVLVRGVDRVEIECLPGDIPEHLVADLTKLITLDDEILVKDLVLPPNVKMLSDPEQVIFAVTPSRAALEEEAPAEETAAAEVEVIRRKSKEEEAEA